MTGIHTYNALNVILYSQINFDVWNQRENEMETSPSYTCQGASSI